jgi:hypothetical protein
MGGKFPSDAGGSPTEFGRPAAVGRRGNGLGVTPVDGDPDLGRKAAGGSPWQVRGGDDDRAEGCTGEGVGRLSLARLVRLESTSELRRRYGWGGWDRRSTRGGGRRWPGNSGDGGLEWSGGSSTVTVGRGVIGFSSGLMARGKVHDWWLHVRHVERKWRLVGSVGCEVAGDRAAVTRAGPVSGRRLEALHKGGGCMCGAWKLGGRWQRSAGTTTWRWALSV